MKIYTIYPRPFFKKGMPDAHVFSRLLGLTCVALREKGVKSRLVLLQGENVREHPDVIRAEPSEIESPAWWAGHELDAVVLGSWALPQYTPVARAIKKSGAKLIIVCDCGSAYSQWQRAIWTSVYQNYQGPRNKGKGPILSAVRSLARTMLAYNPYFYDKKVVAHLALADMVMIETPESARLLKALLLRHAGPDAAARVKYVPHPVNNRMVYNPRAPKEKRIMAVGRWDAYQKNTPMLVRSLDAFLSRHPEYEAHIYGGGEDVLRARLMTVRESVRARVHVQGHVLNDQLIEAYQRSRIFFAPSRSEGSQVAAEEALACGCSVVGSAHILCMLNFVAKNSGTLASRYSVRGMRDALETEHRAWEQGLRNPEEISREWRREVSADAVVEVITSFVRRKGE
jgi:glycosyltransferase involved in cell wall biosynthesis